MRRSMRVRLMSVAVIFLANAFPRKPAKKCNRERGPPATGADDEQLPEPTGSSVPCPTIRKSKAARDDGRTGGPGTGLRTPSEPAVPGRATRSGHERDGPTA